MPQALLSVSDKTGLFELAQGLLALGWRLLASGSTAHYLRQHQLAVTEVADYTQSPELLQGRVKTLHPAIHAGLLARGNEKDYAELQAQGWGYIDLVAVNLYPFQAVVSKPNVNLEEAIENIDIGGVALIRAAAKNYQRVTLLCDPTDYTRVLAALNKKAVTESLRQELAIKGFSLTSQYDAAITQFFNKTEPLQLTLYPQQSLRYGENPHQTATWYSYIPEAGPLGGNLLQGKTLSYNNLLDLDSAWQAVLLFSKPTVAIVKHLSLCGIASASTTGEALQAAMATDPVSAYGGIIASNRQFNEQAVNALAALFVEAIAAPSFSSEARILLQQRANCRLLEIPSLAMATQQELRSISQGVLLQTRDQGDPTGTQWTVATERVPTEEEWLGLKFSWLACQPVRSNAIVLAQGEAAVGIGGGQPNRVDCLEIAAKRAGKRTQGAVLASDAFLPFADTIELAARLGITAIIQPGGSIRDSAVIAAANAANIAIVMTGVRHFRH